MRRRGIWAGPVRVLASLASKAVVMGDGLPRHSPTSFSIDATPIRWL